jgi:hypothetical protein
MIARPTTAKGAFPYPMRTVAEVDAAAFAEYKRAALDYVVVSPHLTWCSQCDGLVHDAAAAICASPLCSLRKARAA